MKEQNYKNHSRWYYPHHFIFYPVIVAGLIISLRAASESSQPMEWRAIAFLFFMLGGLSFMMRQHYALNNQNRIIRLEMRVRYFQLTGQRLEPLEGQLSFGQIAALRFASDEELPDLLNKALKENLSGKDIKKSIKNWQPDHMRV